MPPMPGRASKFKPFSDIENDALTEIANMAMGRAATSLGQLVNSEIKLTVPSVEILSDVEAIKAVTRMGSEQLIAVSEDFRGLFGGRVLLIFPEETSLELVRIVVSKDMPHDELVALENEAIAEIGNIVLNAWVTTLANLLKRNLVMSVPQVLRGGGGELFSSVPLKFVLFLQIDFIVSNTHITGYLALLMDLPSVNALRAVVATFISDHS